jgi:hypothetical protein
MVMKPTYLNNELLTKVFHQFVRDNALRWPGLSADILHFNIKYDGSKWGRTSRNYGLGKAFEEWLFEQGAGVRQISGRLYLEFVDDASATMFTLKWS